MCVFYPESSLGDPPMRKNHLIDIPDSPKFISGVHSYLLLWKIITLEKLRLEAEQEFPEAGSFCVLG
jgi:hypothetical protein